MSTSLSAGVLHARYDAMPGTDIEYGQGAIERNELPHSPRTPVSWFIRVPDLADVALWERRLNESVDPKFGCFTVEPLTEEEQRLVESGEIRFQQ